nr:hypothetical protein Iba_chr12eCG16050 [Ipomoea batatas]
MARESSCLARVAAGAAVGGAVGGAVGAVWGTVEAIRYKIGTRIVPVQIHRRLAAAYPVQSAVAVAAVTVTPPPPPERPPAEQPAAVKTSSPTSSPTTCQFYCRSCTEPNHPTSCHWHPLGAEGMGPPRPCIRA